MCADEACDLACLLPNSSLASASGPEREPLPMGCVNNHDSYLSTNLLRRCAISSPMLFTKARNHRLQGSDAMCAEGRRMTSLRQPALPPNFVDYGDGKRSHE